MPELYLRKMRRCRPAPGSWAVMVLLVIFFMTATPGAFAVQRAHRHRILRIFHFHGLRALLWNPMFRPSHDSMLRQNEEIDRLELPRIADDIELEELKASHDLVPIEENQGLHFDKRLDPSRRYCRQWTRDFVEDLSEVYFRQFHDKIQVNSAVRTVMVQKKLRRHIRKAAPINGDTASSHLPGITVDIQRRGMSKGQIHFVEYYLFYLNALGLVEPEEDRHQWVFHIMVSDRYSDWRQTQTAFPIPVLPFEEPPAAPATVLSAISSN